MTWWQKRMVARYQCPGCVCGSDPACGSYNFNSDERRCIAHVLGTSWGFPGNTIALGLPRGFNKPGLNDAGKARNTIDVRLWPAGESPEWDLCNVPVWAMEKDGVLFVRTFAPRINISWVDVVEGGTMEAVPRAINVGDFANEID